MKDIRRVCKICDCPQFPSPSGWVCRNGHGGADWYPGVVENYTSQYKTWFNKIASEIRHRYEHA